MLQSALELRSDGGAIRHAWDVYGKRQRDERRAAVWCCVIANSVAAVLQVTTLRCCKLRRCGAVAHVAVALRMVRTLRAPMTLRYCAWLERCAVMLRRCGAARGWRCYGAVAHMATMLWRYSTIARVVAVLWRCAWLQHCDAVAPMFFFFFEWLLASLRVFNLFLYVREREKQRARKNKRQLWNLFWSCSSKLLCTRLILALLVGSSVKT